MHRLLIAKKAKSYIIPFNLQTVMYYKVLATPKCASTLYPLTVNAKSIRFWILA